MSGTPPGLHKVVISVIQDNGNSHCSRKILSDNHLLDPPKKVFLTEPVYGTETNFCNTKTVRARNKFYHKKGNVTETSFFQTKILVK